MLVLRVLAQARFAVVLEPAEDEDDLGLREAREGLPERDRVAADAAKLVAVHLPREVDSVGVR
jgi:hypothetical protein